MERPAPIKRHVALIPLSQRHHQLLMLVLLIKQGLRKQVPVEKLSALVAEEFERLALPLFRAERLYLLPLLPPKSGCATIFAEYESKLNTMAAAQNLNTAESLIDFANALEETIRYKERLAYNAMQTQISTEALTGLQSQLSNHLPNNVSCIAPPF